MYYVKIGPISFIRNVIRFHDLMCVSGNIDGSIQLSTNYKVNI